MTVRSDDYQAMSELARAAAKEVNRSKRRKLLRKLQSIANRGGQSLPVIARSGGVVLASDNFDRADENPLAGGWTNATSGFKIVAGAATFISNTDSEAYYSGIAWPSNQFSRAQLSVTGSTGVGSGAGLIVRRAVDARTSYRLAVDHAVANNVQLGVFLVGVYTVLASATQSWFDGDTWELRAQGTALTALRNGVVVLTVTDTRVSDGSAGIAYSSTESAITLDNWEGGAL